jgi:hypothetical protein
VKVILAKPHIRAAAAYRVGLLSWVVLDRSRVQDRPDVYMILKYAQSGSGGIRSRRKHGKQSQAECGEVSPMNGNMHFHALNLFAFGVGTSKVQSENVIMKEDGFQKAEPRAK